LIRRASVLCIFLFACNAAAVDRTQPLPTADPPSPGFSPARLERVTSYVQSAIDQGQYAGAVTLIARRGRIVQWQALGHRDVARSNPMRPDSIFQIYSMTKPITSVAALLLMEEGRLLLDDPVSRFIPQFASMQVLEGENAATARLRPAARPITLRHLLTHTAGFAAGEKLKGPAVDRMLEAQLDQSLSLEASAIAVSALPLANDPGTRFSYDGVSTEVLSRVVEVAAGMPFDDFLRTRLFKPLRMLDTDFSVPRDERNRIVEMASTDAAGRLVTADAKQNPAGNMLKRYPSGAGGLYSTAGDYVRFCQMLLNGGELDGVRILGRKTVELMMANHLTHLSPPVNEFSDAEGFGLGGYVVLDPARRGLLSSVGQFGWSGAAGTWFTIDPQEQLIAILMMQHLPRRLPRDPPRLNRPFNNLVYQALTDSH
jgi:CubicO group peptidase (beta-lactamase class C family)